MTGLPMWSSWLLLVVLSVLGTVNAIMPDDAEPSAGDVALLVFSLLCIAHAASIVAAA